MKKTTTLATANIGLPRVGEMFVSQITRGTKTEFWTLTPATETNLRYISTVELMRPGYPTGIKSVRPSMYLKSNVVIASDNIGNGTYEKPYSIELGV